MVARFSNSIFEPSGTEIISNVEITAAESGVEMGGYEGAGALRDMTKSLASIVIISCNDICEAIREKTNYFTLSRRVRCNSRRVLM